MRTLYEEGIRTLGERALHRHPLTVLELAYLYVEGRGGVVRLDDAKNLLEWMLRERGLNQGLRVKATIVLIDVLQRIGEDRNLTQVRKLFDWGLRHLGAVADDPSLEAEFLIDFADFLRASKTWKAGDFQQARTLYEQHCKKLSPMMIYYSLAQRWVLPTCCVLVRVVRSMRYERARCMNGLYPKLSPMIIIYIMIYALVTERVSRSVAA